MILKDSFYTSTPLAAELIAYVKDREFKSVADFCVGDGELLRAAQLNWKNIKCYGVDISEEAISQLKLTHPTWTVSTCDFIDDNYKQICTITENTSKYDLILLNPPFTCKGSAIHKIVFDNKEYKVSTAMMFLVKALQHLHKDSVLLAILPISCAYSQKDQQIWQYLEKKYQLRVLEERDKQYFKNCNPNILLVSLNDFSLKETNKNRTKVISLGRFNVSISRGNLSVHECKAFISKNGKFFVHSTNLIGNSLKNLTMRIDYTRSEISGPAVLIPRVGRPSIKKICTISKKETYVISDCILAIKTKTYAEAMNVKKALTTNWDYIQTLYNGTAAKYITMDRLHTLLDA